jgi:hypothetical protein
LEGATALAVELSASVAVMSSSVLCELSANCTRPLAILNRNTPGIIDTTEANPIAANGMCHRRETGVRTSPTTRHARKAPVAALNPNTARATVALAVLFGVQHLRAAALIFLSAGISSVD